MDSLHFDNYGQAVDHFTFQQEIKIREDHIAALKSQVETLRQELEQSGERFQHALMSSGQWRQRAELAERQRDELIDRINYRKCLACHGSGITGTVLFRSCIRCRGTGKEPA